MTKEGDLSCGNGHAGKTQLSVGTSMYYHFLSTWYICKAVADIQLGVTHPQEPLVGKTLDDINEYNNYKWQKMKHSQNESQNIPKPMHEFPHPKSLRKVTKCC